MEGQIQVHKFLGKMMRTTFILASLAVLASCGPSTNGIDVNDAFPLGVGKQDVYIDRSGVPISKSYGVARRFFEGYASVRDSEGSYSLIDRFENQKKLGRVALVGDFHEGLAVIAGEDDHWGFIDGNGSWIIKLDEKLKPEDFSDGFALVHGPTDNNVYFINRGGHKVFNQEYEWAESFSEGLAAVKKDGQFLFIDTKGQTALELQVQRLSSFHDGLAAFMMNDNGEKKWGYIDNTGAVVVAPKFEDVGDFSEGYTFALQNGKFGCIDKQGNWVIEPKYDRLYEPHESAMAFMLNKKWGFVGIDGKIIHEAEFDDLDKYFFKNGMALVSNWVVKDGANYPDDGYLRKDGTVIWGRDIKMPKTP